MQFSTQKIKQIRKRLGKTQEDFAKAIDTSRSNYTRKEKGTTAFFTEDIAALSNKFKIDITEFFEYDINDKIAIDKGNEALEEIKEIVIEQNIKISRMEKENKILKDSLATLDNKNIELEAEIGKLRKVANNRLNLKINKKPIIQKVSSTNAKTSAGSN